MVVFQRTAPLALPTPSTTTPPCRKGSAGSLRARAALRGLVPLLDLLDDFGGTARLGRGRGRLAASRAFGGSRERRDPRDADGVPAEACAGDQALFEKTFDYPPFAKRFVWDDGLLPATYRRDDVTLETTGIERITERGVRLVDGREVELDVLIYGTGFKASDFLVPMTIVGRGGRSLHDVWQGDARAHLGITLPGFPNLFLLYGPNTNIVVNGSIIYFSECEVDYLVDCLRFLLEGGHAAIDCRSEAHDAYNRRIDAANRRRAWGASDVSAWYKNRFGRVSQNWPWGLLAYWDQTRAIDPAEYEVLGSTDGP
ncbi:MAG: hypothetical protein R3E53_09665 [Myxococcota bacterium]